MKRLLSVCLLLFAFSLSMFADLDIKTYQINGTCTELGLNDGEKVDVIMNESRDMSFTHPWMYSHSIELDRNVSAGYWRDGWKQIKYRIKDSNRVVWVEFYGGDGKSLTKSIRIKGNDGKYCYLQQE